MSFGTLGATSTAAADNAANLLAMLKAVQETPKAVISDMIAAAEDLKEQRAALERTLQDIATAQAELDKKLADLQSKQDEINATTAKMRKLLS